MPASLASLARRIAKIEKDRGLARVDGSFNRLLVGIGEEACDNEDQAFLVFLKQSAKLSANQSDKPHRDEQINTISKAVDADPFMKR